MEGFTNGSEFHILKIFSGLKDLDCELFYSELKRHLHYILYHTDIHRVRKR